MKWHNHEMPSLSVMDREIISHIPQGGNWQNVPADIPSKRLEQIREMARQRGVVRTTYYGRLKPHQPSYTINTYFNRPGNGTHIHPFVDRTLTSREAARLQSFPDNYRFYGSEASVRTQIGNAVPPLLAYSLGKELIKVPGNKTCVDVFCGAGGLSLGLEWAGWNSILGIDNNAGALKTYVNNRENKVTDSLNADLHIEEEMNKAISIIGSKLKGQQLHLLAGGPPCQGFSHAGFRNPNDTRNDLAVNYLMFAKKLKPQVFLLENVEGILTMKKGQVMKDLIKSIEDIGYNVTIPVWKLNAEEYGVPQMRRRVFLLATLDDSFSIKRPYRLFNPCLGRRKKSNQLIIDPSLPDPINVSEAFLGLSNSLEDSNTRTEYSKWINGIITLEEFERTYH